MKIYLIILIGIFALNSCKHDISSDNKGAVEAVLLGYDNRNCDCCGGLMISFLPQPDLFPDQFKLIGNLPSNTGLNDSTVYPLKVLVKWKYGESVCGDEFIDITWLKIK